MKQIYFDQNQSVLIKIFPTSQAVEREICGAKTFSQFVEVPQIERLDNKVAKLSFIPGFLGYQVSEACLNSLIAKFLFQVKAVNKPSRFSIREEIDSLISFFEGDQQTVGELQKIAGVIKDLEFVPIHGDLQKQNILINEGNLGLIDFEHFILAPRELELCNSLFFNDGNCLNIKEIVALLPQNFFDKKILELILRFFKFKQIFLGIDCLEAESKFKLALNKVESLFTINKNKVVAAKRYYLFDLYSRYSFRAS